MFRFAGACVLFALLSACSTYEFPGVHRITVQQGNVVTQAMIDKLKPGMTKRQVQFVMGNPVIDDQLNKDRWDYVYTIDVPGIQKLQKNLKVFFIEDRLSHFEGDYAPSEVINATAATN
ncbi:MAG: outer membrane protein assembly factor BamE [Pseudomonadales bacterium]|jgi:outer membrane protein assembly factor BamE